MNNNIKEVLDKLRLEDVGTYENHFYVINISNSDEYAKMYTRLCDAAVNAEYPMFGTNSSDSTIKVTTYFTLDVNETTYNLFLIADFDEDIYKLKIGEK